MNMSQLKLSDFINAGSILTILYFALCGGAFFFLYKIRDRQPGNTRYTVAIYCGMAADFLLILLGFWIAGKVL